MTRNEIFKSLGRKDLIGQPFDEVEFLGLFHPNYNCDEIAWEGDLQKFVDGEVEEGDAAEWCVKEYGLNIYDAEVDRLELYCRNILAAIENYHRLRKS